MLFLLIKLIKQIIWPSDLNFRNLESGIIPHIQRWIPLAQIILQPNKIIIIAQRCLKWMKNFLPEQEFEPSNCHDIISPLYSAKDANLLPYVFHGTVHCDDKMREENHKMRSASESLRILSLLCTSPSTLGVYVYMRKSQFFNFEIYYTLYQFKFAPESSKYGSFYPTHFFLSLWNSHITTSSSVFDIAASSKL